LAPTTDVNKKTDQIEYAEYGILIPSFSKNNIYQESEQDNKKEKILADAIIELLENKKMKVDYENKARQRIKDFEPEVIKGEWFKLLEMVRDEKENEKG